MPNALIRLDFPALQNEVAYFVSFYTGIGGEIFVKALPSDASYSRVPSLYWRCKSTSLR